MLNFGEKKNRALLFIANSDCDFVLMAKRTVFVSATNMILPLNTSGEWYVDLNWNGKGVCIASTFE
jgi:hypothetical protein